MIGQAEPQGRDAEFLKALTESDVLLGVGIPVWEDKHGPLALVLFALRHREPAAFDEIVLGIGRL
jgi:hypothetical protein